jgi:hypothetical protein
VKKSPDADVDEAEQHTLSHTTESTLRKIYLGLGSGGQGYSSTLRVESSLGTPGSHRITHTTCDTGSGLTQTVHEETVEAATLRTTMSIQ